MQRVVASVRPTRPAWHRHRRAQWALACALTFVLTLLGGYARPAGAAPGTVPGATPGEFSAGSSGAGDPYFPLDGNGGYDVRHYVLDVRYDPATKRLAGAATIIAVATQDLAAFNLDLVGLTVRSIEVNGVGATWARTKGELAVTPAVGLPLQSAFTTVVRYDGVPTAIHEPTRIDAASGFLHSPDGALFAGEPHVASRWFPVNDTLLDKAAYTFRVTVPTGRTAVANGVLVGTATDGAWTTWTWEAAEPMVPYLAGLTIGTFDLKAYTKNGLPFWDAVESSLVRRIQPRTGARYAIAATKGTAYKRLTRTIRVPAKGSTLSFWVNRVAHGETAFLVEAHTPGRDDWTTLPDRNGHTSSATGEQCALLVDRHPFLAHYLTPKDGRCTPRGTTAKPGRWFAGTKKSGYQHWSVDLARFAGRQVEVAITYVTADEQTGPGVFVDDLKVSRGAGSTSFEKDRNIRDGWRSAKPPTGSPKGGWTIGRTSDGPGTIGERAQAVLGKNASVLEFLAARFGPYPFGSSGGIVHGFPFSGALENQTRPTYAAGFFRDTDAGIAVVVHELAHQWFGASVTPAAWRDIWLNEGFATYVEWMWSDAHGGPTAQQSFDRAYRGPNNPFWSVPIGDPGPGRLFDFAVYDRGAMTLHQLRRTIGDDRFFVILRQWAEGKAGQNVTTRDFIDLAEQVSGLDLAEFFSAWLYTGTRPVVS